MEEKKIVVIEKGIESKKFHVTEAPHSIPLYFLNHLHQSMVLRGSVTRPKALPSQSKSYCVVFIASHSPSFAAFCFCPRFRTYQNLKLIFAIPQCPGHSTRKERERRVQALTPLFGLLFFFELGSFSLLHVRMWHWQQATLWLVES